MEKQVKLRKVREAEGLSQRELAEAIGITRVAITRIETGESGGSIGTLLALADYFGRSPAWGLTLTDWVN